MTPEQFQVATGRVPERDELERVNCDKVGEKGHRLCGWCIPCNRPRYDCGHGEYGGGGE